MNLLLYTEAKMKLARRLGEVTTTRPTGLWNDTDVTLPDSLFEELGYFGAVEKEPTEPEDDDSIEDLINAWAEPALSW